MKLTSAFALSIFVFLVACNKEPSSTSVAAKAGDWDTDAKREWAANLRNEGLEDEAIATYEDLINHDGGLSKSAIIGSSVVIAEIHMKKGRYQKALASLLRAAQLRPEGELGRRIDTWRIECLERLGKGAAADRLLDRASKPSGERSAAKTTDVVVAEIGQEQIHLAELEALIAQQSPELRARIETKEGKLELLKNLVAQRVMERKARKLGLTKDEKVQLAIELATRDILVRKLVADEVAGKIDVSDKDAKLYFEANRARFREPNQVQVAHIVVDDLEREKAVREALEKEKWQVVCARLSQDQASKDKGGVIEGVVVEGQSHDTMRDVKGLFTAIGETKAGAVAPKSMKTSAGRHIIKVLRRQDGKPYPFEKVKDAAAKMLRAEREQAAIGELMHQALKQSDVKIFEDKLSQ